MFQKVYVATATSCQRMFLCKKIVFTAKHFLLFDKTFGWFIEKAI